MKRAAIAPLALGFGVAAAVAACGPTHSASMSPSESAAVAQAKANYAQIAHKCGVDHASGQLAAAKDFAHSGTKAGLNDLLAKCGVPEQNRHDAETKLLDAAETAHLTKHDGRVTYFTVTFPRIIQQEQA